MSAVEVESLEAVVDLEDHSFDGVHEEGLDAVRHEWTALVAGDRRLCAGAVLVRLSDVRGYEDVRVAAPYCVGYVP